MGEFVRILKASRTSIVALQLLQTMSIMIQNLRNEHSICKLSVLTRTFLLANVPRCSIFHILVSDTIHLVYFADYMFSNEHINFLITYAFDFHNEELLSYYISFLRSVYITFSLVA